MRRPLTRPLLWAAPQRRRSGSAHPPLRTSDAPAMPSASREVRVTASPVGGVLNSNKSGGTGEARRGFICATHFPHNCFFSLSSISSHPLLPPAPLQAASKAKAKAAAPPNSSITYVYM